MTNLDSYGRLVGKLNYLTITRLHISFAVAIYASPVFLRSSLWEVALRIIKYLKAHPECGLLYRANGHLRVGGIH